MCRDSLYISVEFCFVLFQLLSIPDHSSQTRDHQTHCAAVETQSLNLWTTRETPQWTSLMLGFSSSFCVPFICGEAQSPLSLCSIPPSDSVASELCLKDPNDSANACQSLFFSKHELFSPNYQLNLQSLRTIGTEFLYFMYLFIERECACV